MPRLALSHCQATSATATSTRPPAVRASAHRRRAPATGVLSDGLIPGMQELGPLFKDGQAFLPEILISVRAMDMGLAVLQPHLVPSHVRPRRAPWSSEPSRVTCTTSARTWSPCCSSGNGFEVVDLGVDVSAAAFVAAAPRTRRRHRGPLRAAHDNDAAVSQGDRGPGGGRPAATARWSWSAAPRVTARWLTKSARTASLPTA